ncbi:exonuclease domain-containing protein [Rubrivivax sp. A210]|uniref:3'-5' exonuclease n=1 Tax=Rubrivivax sp. A210 TaxID=2772301 RepID=UPI00191A2E10|nr:exonuclease domain-containing protein [Rubrivivax sp. A210]
MKLDLHRIAASVLPGLLLALVLGGLGGLVAATLEPAERAALWALVEPRIGLVVMLWFVVALACGIGLGWAWEHFGRAPGRLAERLQVLLASDTPRELEAAGSAGSRALTAAVNNLLGQRDALRADTQARIAEASREVAEERNRLAALMAELTQSVVVCNLDGRILLFNARARLQFRALTEGPAIGGAEVIGLGRSIYGVLDRRLVAHALEAVQQRLQRGAAHPTAQFVTGTRGGQLLRIQMTPVRAPGDEAASLNGFVLMLDNITRDLADDTERDGLLHQLTEGHRGSLGNLQAAVELLDDPELDAATRERFLAVIRDEIGGMTRRLNEAAERGLRDVRSRWPLEDMLGADFVAAAARRIESQLGLRVSTGEVDGQLWLKVDSYTLIQALQHLAGRLAEEYDIQRVQLRLGSAVQNGVERGRLDLVWAVQAMSTETVTAWETEPLRAGDETSALTVRDVIARHGGALWFERARIQQEAFFRILLPLAGEAAPLHAELLGPQSSRPEFYDFDLFAAGQAHQELAQQHLAELSYTVFDTETTGLQPSQGDEIIQIGATRIVAGKLRRQESFEQLVDPQRSVPEAGVAIHGIQPEMLRGQPPITTVLPAFHAFAHDTVLVAHNAAFDMRFLQLKEDSTGIKFDQPVLDTLLLSAVIHPNQESHRLEAIAERLGVTVLGRHTALGDAMVTAEVFLKMVPLLRQIGITTLGQALDASRETYLARVSY